MKPTPFLRLDARNVLRCAVPRQRGVGLDCDTPIARPTIDSLVVRCRNCAVDHIFRVVNGVLVWAERPAKGCRLPEGERVS